MSYWHSFPKSYAKNRPSWLFRVCSKLWFNGQGSPGQLPLFRVFPGATWTAGVSAMSHRSFKHKAGQVTRDCDTVADVSNGTSVPDVPVQSRT